MGRKENEIKTSGKLLAILTAASIFGSYAAIGFASDAQSVTAGNVTLSKTESTEIDLFDSINVTYPDGTDASAEEAVIENIVYDNMLTISGTTDAQADGIGYYFNENNSINMTDRLEGVWKFETEMRFTPINYTNESNPFDGGWRFKVQGANNDAMYTELYLKPDYGMKYTINWDSGQTDEDHIIKSGEWAKIAFEINMNTNRVLVSLNGNQIYNKEVPTWDSIKGSEVIKFESIAFSGQTIDKSVDINYFNVYHDNVFMGGTDFSDISNVGQLAGKGLQIIGTNGINTISDKVYTNVAVDCEAVNNGNIKTLKPIAGKFDITKNYRLSAGNDTYDFTAKNLNSNLMFEGMTTANGVMLENNGYVTTENKQLFLDFSEPIDESSLDSIKMYRKKTEDVFNITANTANGGPELRYYFNDDKQASQTDRLTGIWKIETEMKFSPIATQSAGCDPFYTAWSFKVQGKNNDNAYTELYLRPDYGMKYTTNYDNGQIDETHIIKSDEWAKIEIELNMNENKVSVILNGNTIYADKNIASTVTGLDCIKFCALSWQEKLDKSVDINYFNVYHNGGKIAGSNFADATLSGTGLELSNTNGSTSFKKVLYSQTEVNCTAAVDENNKKLVIVTPNTALGYLDTYEFKIGSGLMSDKQAQLANPETFTFTSVYYDGVYAKSVNTELNDKTYTATAKLVNYSHSIKNIDLIIVVYDGDKMIDCLPKTVSVALGEESYDVSITLNDVKSDYTAECYVWSSLDKMQPVCPKF